MAVVYENLSHDLGTDALVSGAVAGVPFSLSEKTTAHTVKIGANVKLKGLARAAIA